MEVPVISCSSRIVEPECIGQPPTVRSLSSDSRKIVQGNTGTAEVIPSKFDYQADGHPGTGPLM